MIVGKVVIHSNSPHPLADIEVNALVDSLFMFNVYVSIAAIIMPSDPLQTSLTPIKEEHSPRQEEHHSLSYS